MADQEKQNQALPETQEILSQFTQDDSQSLYSETTVIQPPWAKLLYMIDQRITVGKRQ